MLLPRLSPSKSHHHPNGWHLLYQFIIPLQYYIFSLCLSHFDLNALMAHRKSVLLLMPLVKGHYGDWLPLVLLVFPLVLRGSCDDVFGIFCQRNWEWKSSDPSSSLVFFDSLPRRGKRVACQPSLIRSQGYRGYSVVDLMESQRFKRTKCTRDQLSMHSYHSHFSSKSTSRELSIIEYKLFISKLKQWSSICASPYQFDDCFIITKAHFTLHKCLLVASFLALMRQFII